VSAAFAGPPAGAAGAAVIIDDASLGAVRWDLVILLAASDAFALVAWRLFRWE
jgi:hypothetical protein